MNTRSALAMLAVSALFALAAACANGTPTPGPSPTTSATSTPGGGPTATATSVAATPTATSVAGIPTTVASPTATATSVPIDIDLTGLDPVDASIDLEGVFGEMYGLDVGQLDVQTEYMTDLEAPTEVEMPDLDFTLELP